MGFRYRKRIKLLGFYWNFSKHDLTSVSAGKKGFTTTCNFKKGVSSTASMPGTGISYNHKWGKKAKAASNGNGANGSFFHPHPDSPLGGNRKGQMEELQHRSQQNVARIKADTAGNDIEGREIAIATCRDWVAWCRKWRPDNVATWKDVIASYEKEIAEIKSRQQAAVPDGEPTAADKLVAWCAGPTEPEPAEKAQAAEDQLVQNQRAEEMKWLSIEMQANPFNDDVIARIIQLSMEGETFAAKYGFADQLQAARECRETLEKHLHGIMPTLEDLAAEEKLCLGLREAQERLAVDSCDVSALKQAITTLQLLEAWNRRRGRYAAFYEAARERHQKDLAEKMATSLACSTEM